MPDGSKMDMKDTAPAKKPAPKLPQARLPPAKPIAKPKESSEPTMGAMHMPEAKSSASMKGMDMPKNSAPTKEGEPKPMNGMVMPMNASPDNSGALKAGVEGMGGMTMPNPTHSAEHMTHISPWIYR